MKRTLIVLISLLIITCNQVYGAINVKSTGSTIISSNQIYTPIQVYISALASLNLTMKVKALDSFITNTSNSSYKIPISQLYLNDGINEFQMLYNTSVTTINNISIGFLGYTKNYNCIIKNIGVLPPGTYTTRLQFETNTTFETFSTVYTLAFTIPLTQEISTITNPVNINLSQDKVFEAGTTIENTTTPQIVLRSNGKWKLVLKTSNLGNLIGDYYFLITAVSPNVTNYINTQTQILPNTQYVLAEGPPTVTTPVTGTYTTDYINIKYLLKNPTNRYLQEGTFNNSVTYTIQNGE